MNGWLVPVKNISALTQRMEWFIKNPHLIEQMGEAARLVAENQYNVNEINSSIIQIMRDSESE